MGMKDYYDILEINETASTEVIKAAYRALVKKYHPDNYELENEDITERMAELNEAYAVLSDEKKRKDYDIQYTSINSPKKERNHKPESTPCTSCILRSPADSDAFQSGRCAEHNGRPETPIIVS